MQRERKPKNFLPKPIYPGGPKAMSQFISANIKYPEEALLKKIEGTVVLRIEINFKGKVTGSKIRSSLGYGCDEEAQRLVELLKFEVDHQVRGGKVLFHKTLNIHFHLSSVTKTKTAEPEIQTQLSYVIIKKQKKTSPASYNYTITY